MLVLDILGRALTLGDALRQAMSQPGLTRLGGLHAGRLVVNLRARSLRLKGHTYVPCLGVAGTLHVLRDRRITGQLRVIPVCRGPVPTIIQVLPSGVRARFLVSHRGIAFTSNVASLVGAPLRLPPAPPAPGLVR